MNVEQLAEKKRLDANARKKKSRKNLAPVQGCALQVLLSGTERATLDHSRTIRGGVTGAYDTNEYILTLIRQDAAKLARQTKKLGGCSKCNQPLPGGCAGDYVADSGCFYALNNKALAL